MSIFDHIVLNARPASGKSEFIDCLKRTPLNERKERFHIGNIVELDDFLWLQEKFVEDDVLEHLGEKRLHSIKDGHYYRLTQETRLLDLVYEKFNYIVARDYLNKKDFYGQNTLFLEFSRGGSDGGYRRAYNALSREILGRAVIVYVSVSAEESFRRNEARYQEKLKLSVLAHKVPEADMIRWNTNEDWKEISNGRESGYLNIGGINVPFVSVNNEPEIKDPVALGERYEPYLNKLMELNLCRNSPSTI